MQRGSQWNGTNASRLFVMSSVDWEQRSPGHTLGTNAAKKKNDKTATSAQLLLCRVWQILHLEETWFDRLVVAELTRERLHSSDGIWDEKTDEFAQYFHVLTNIWTDVEAIKGIFFKTLEEQQTQTKFTVSNVAFERSIIEAAPHESRPQIFRNSDSHCENAVHSAVNVIICGVCQEILNLSVFVSALTHPSACDASRLLMLQLSNVIRVFSNHISLVSS